MNKEDSKTFLRLRKKVADYICEYLKDDWGHKSYEGTWEVMATYPNYFEDSTATADPDGYGISLHCYVLGPHRHYEWYGKTFREALKKCEHDIDQMIQEETLT